MLSAIDRPEKPAQCGTMYCDGGARPNPGKGAWGLWGTDSDGREYNAWGYVGDMVTNNRAELYGYITVLEIALHMGWTELVVYFDSKYVQIGASKSLEKWKANGWKTDRDTDVSNRDAWEKVDFLQQAFLQKGTINYNWVKGHSGDPGNEKADENATRALLAGAQGVTDPCITITDADKPVKYKSAAFNKLIAGRSLFFTTNLPMRTEDGLHIYMVNSFDDSKRKDGSGCGVNSASAFYGVVLAKDPVEQLEAVINYQNSITPDDFIQPVVGKMDTITKPEIWHWIGQHGSSHFKHQRLNVMTVEGDPLTNYLRPPRKALDTVDALAVMHQRLEDYRAGETVHEYTDITDALYQKEKKKWKLTENVSGSEKAVAVEVEHEGKKVDVTLTLGIDLPPRNNLSAIAKQTKELKVLLVKHTTTPTTFRYSTIFVTDTDFAIYGTTQANLKVV